MKTNETVTMSSVFLCIIRTAMRAITARSRPHLSSSVKEPPISRINSMIVIMTILTSPPGANALKGERTMLYTGYPPASPVWTYESGTMDEAPSASSVTS